MEKFCNSITDPAWCSVVATIFAAIVAAWITYKLGKMQNELQQKQVDIQERQNDLQAQQVKLQEQQNELQRQQIQQQEYELYRKMYSQVYGVDFFNKTILLRIVAILISNEDNKLRLKFVDDIWEECEKRTMEFTECALDMELKQCGEALDAKYYSDALQASQKVIQMFKYFVENELMAFDPQLINVVQMESTTPPEKFIDIILKLFRAGNEERLRQELFAFAKIVEKTNQAQLLKVIKDRITPTEIK